MPNVLRITVLALVLACTPSAVLARPIHVDNRNGYDGNDGLAPEVMTPLTGPLLTLRRALKIARRGDHIILRNTGVPYAESLFLNGGSHSGFANEPFVIQGNGAVLSGVATVPSDGWQEQPNGLWRLSLTRKGYYRFFRGGEPVTEQIFPSSTWTAEDLPVNHWASSRGAVYFQLERQESPLTENWTYAAAEMGVSLVNVQNVRIVDLNIVGFRIDGLNADGQSREVVLENVSIQHSGRAGIAVGGSSQLTVLNSRVTDNGRHSILVTERGGVQLEDCELGGVEPTVQP